MAKFDSTDDTHQREKPVTMRKVAQQAGVSMATVSRVLNGSAPVDPLVAERVRRVMASLKYQPNQAARALAGSDSLLIGLLIADIQNPFFIDVMRGVEEEVRRNGYLLVMGSIPITGEKERYKMEEKYIEILASAPVAGMIILPVQKRLKSLELLKARHIPVVAIDQCVSDPSIDTVRIDNVMAAKEAVAHLIANGYRRIGIINGPPVATTANERLQGYHQALQEANITPDPALEQRGPFMDDAAERLTHILLDLDPPVDAIFTTNNRLTIGALRAMHSRNIRVPDDVAFVGFDEVLWAIPDLVSLTTVTQPAYDIGKTAANRLIQRLHQQSAPKHDIILPYQLLIRESSRPRLSRNPQETLISSKTTDHTDA